MRNISKLLVGAATLALVAGLPLTSQARTFSWGSPTTTYWHTEATVPSWSPNGPPARMNYGPGPTEWERGGAPPYQSNELQYQSNEHQYRSNEHQYQSHQQMTPNSQTEFDDSDD